MYAVVFTPICGSLIMACIHRLVFLANEHIETCLMIREVRARVMHLCEYRAVRNIGWCFLDELDDCYLIIIYIMKIEVPVHTCNLHICYRIHIPFTWLQHSVICVSS